jgi:hypothetical protein
MRFHFLVRDFTLVPAPPAFTLPNLSRNHPQSAPIPGFRAKCARHFWQETVARHFFDRRIPVACDGKKKILTALSTSIEPAATSSHRPVAVSSPRECLSPRPVYRNTPHWPRPRWRLPYLPISNFFGCSTGRSAGLAPFRILST